MPVLCWILLVIVLLIALLCLTRVGVRASFGGTEGLRLDVRFGLLRIHILPAKPKKEKKPPKEKKPKKEKKQKEKPEAEKKKLSIAWEDIKDAAQTMFPALKRALRRIGRGIRFKPLHLSLVLGGLEDPAASAQLYGEIQAAVWGGMPQIEGLMDIRDVHIHTDVDYLSSGPAVEGEIGVTFRVGTLIALAFGLAVPALRWFLRWRKRCKTRPPKSPRGKKKKEAEPSEPQPHETKDPAA